ncbi:MAG: NUDIX hydrolase [Candidatus Thermoplasmatota archaeon]|nr:NUDIX hydrolase [Candidatus Thermoplasmatota archaeon]
MSKISDEDWGKIAASMEKSFKSRRENPEAGILEKLKQQESNGECRIIKNEKWTKASKKAHEFERHVDRVMMEVRLQREDITWVLREVERFADGESTPNRIRFDHPQGKVDYVTDGDGEERWMRAAYRELLEEVNIDLHFLDEERKRVYPEIVDVNASFTARTFVSQRRFDGEERDPFGGSFPGLTRVTNTRHFICQVIEPIDTLIDITKPIIEHDSKKGVKNYFRWFPSDDGSNWEFGRSSSGIQITHPFDLLDGLKRAKKKTRSLFGDKNLKWAQVHTHAKNMMIPDTSISHTETKWNNSEFVAERLDSEHRKDRNEYAYREIGRHNDKMQAVLHTGHRQVGTVQFTKILLRMLKDSKKGNPLIPYGQLTREFGLHTLNESILCSVFPRMAGGPKIKKYIKEQSNALHREIFGEDWGHNTPAPEPSKKWDNQYWLDVHGQIVDALTIGCESCEKKVGEPCNITVRGEGDEKTFTWATMDGDGKNKTRLGPSAKKKGIGKEYNLIIRDYLKEKRKITTGNWNDLKSTPNGWEYDWENYFPLVCNKRLKAACYSIDLQHFFDLTIEDDDAGKQSKRAPSLYFSNQILSPISLRNRIIHSLERYIVSKREQRKSFHRTPIGLGYAMRYSLATGELLNIGQEETVEIDSRDKKEIEIPIFGYSSEQNKLVLDKDRKWEWNIFDTPIPSLNLDDDSDKGFLPSVQVDTPLIEIYSAFCQGHPAVMVRRDYYVKSDGETKWKSPTKCPPNDKFLEVKGMCITPGQLVQSASDENGILKNEDVIQIRSVLGVLEADTFLTVVLPNFMRKLASIE